MEVVRKRAEERERVVREAREWARRLGYKSTVILVGSYARGDFNKWSDVDVVVISDEIAGSPLERLEKVDAPPGYEVVVWTLSELKAMLKKKNPLAVEATRSGVILRDDYDIAKELSHREQAT